MTYRPLFASEKLLAGPPYLGCRVSSIWHALAIATSGESTLTPSGIHKGRNARRADLQRGWDAFLATGDDNGIPDQGDVIVIQDAIVKGLPEPRILTNAHFAEAWDAIGQYAVSIALDLSAVGALSPLRRFTGPVAHQVVIRSKNATHGLVIDPMHEQGTGLYAGHWCPKEDIRKAAMAMGRGSIFAELYPAGAWTQARLQTASLRKDVARLTSDNRSLNAKVIDLSSEIARLEQEAATVEEAAEAARIELLDELHDWEGEHR